MIDYLSVDKAEARSAYSQILPKSQQLISNYEEGIINHNLNKEAFEMYLHNLRHDIPFFNILTLRLIGNWTGNTILEKNSNIDIYKLFQFDLRLNKLKIMNVKSTNPLLNELNELDLRVEEDKLYFLDIVRQLQLSEPDITKITALLTGNMITMGENLGYIGRLLGLSDTNIITSGCNNYTSDSVHLNNDLLRYIHDDPNDFAFGVRNTTYRKKLLKQNKKYRLTQRLKQRIRSRQYHLRQRFRKGSRKGSRQYHLRKGSRKGSRKRLK